MQFMVFCSSTKSQDSKTIKIISVYIQLQVVGSKQTSNLVPTP